jgi:hypothetical protein
MAFKIINGSLTFVEDVEAPVVQEELQTLLAQVTDENLHPVVFDGEPVGIEAFAEAPVEASEPVSEEVEVPVEEVVETAPEEISEDLSIIPSVNEAPIPVKSTSFIGKMFKK